MNLKNMKMSAAETKSMIEPMPSKDSASYPYGLSIHLEDSVMQKLGLEKLPKTGTQMMLMAIVEVKRVVDEDSDEGGKRQSMSIQITDMALEPKKEKKDLASALYGNKQGMGEGTEDETE